MEGWHASLDVVVYHAVWMEAWVCGSAFLNTAILSVLWSSHRQYISWVEPLICGSNHAMRAHCIASWVSKASWHCMSFKGLLYDSLPVSKPTFGGTRWGALVVRRPVISKLKLFEFNFKIIYERSALHLHQCCTLSRTQSSCVVMISRRERKAILIWRLWC